jgi:hypothetical protein
MTPSRPSAQAYVREPADIVADSDRGLLLNAALGKGTVITPVFTSSAFVWEQ